MDFGFSLSSPYFTRSYYRLELDVASLRTSRGSSRFKRYRHRSLTPDACTDSLYSSIIGQTIDAMS
jgi:hypothetical protein